MEVRYAIILRAEFVGVDAQQGDPDCVSVTIRIALCCAKWGELGEKLGEQTVKQTGG